MNNNATLYLSLYIYTLGLHHVQSPYVLISFDGRIPKLLGTYVKTDGPYWAS